MALGGTNFNMLSSTHLDPYASIEVTAATGYTAGQMLKYNDIVAVVPMTVTSGHQVVLIYRATKIVVPCAIVTSGNLSAYDEGCKVYFSAAGAEVTTVAGGNTLCGTVNVQPAVGDETVEIDLDGRLGIVA